MAERICTECWFFAPVPTWVEPPAWGYSLKRPGQGHRQNAQDAPPTFTWSDGRCEAFDSRFQPEPVAQVQPPSGPGMQDALRSLAGGATPPSMCPPAGSFADGSPRPPSAGTAMTAALGEPAAFTIDKRPPAG